jgi:hypothetical protein
MGCRFCYEQHMPKLFSALEWLHIPPYDEASFQQFEAGLEGSADDVRRTFPGHEFHVVEISMAVRQWRLSIEDLTA